MMVEDAYEALAEAYQFGVRPSDEVEQVLREHYRYDRWPSGEPYPWGQAARETEWDRLDFAVDLGCGRLKKGRIGVDRFAAPGVDIVMNLDKLSHYSRGVWRGIGRLPFADSSIPSIISCHAFEHLGDGFIPLIDECYRVLEPGGILRAITPLFPSWSAVSDPDHRRYFMAAPDGPSTWDSFTGTPGDTPLNCWLASFSVPYTTARFEKVHQDLTPPPEDPADYWTPNDSRELRVALKAVK